MTTIDECDETMDKMDEFFNFDDAAHPLDINGMGMDFTNLAAGPYDADLAFAHETDDENHFTCLQHFSAPEDDQVLSLQLNALTDTTMMGPADFTDFPRWIDGMDVPDRPCAYCSRLRLHCKVLREGIRKGSCTSCVALARSCSLTHPYGLPNSETNHSGTFCIPMTVDDTTGEDIQMEACEHCYKSGLECHVIKEGQNMGSCTNCVSFACECKARSRDVVQNDWRIEDHHGSDSFAVSRSGSNSNLVSLKGSDENINAAFVETGPKVGARFSRESIRILRTWLSTHHAHPYPTDEEKESLRRQTGLNKVQITNWLANARRRGKVRPPRSTSPSVQNYANAMDIPRRSTPALENMNPLERWKNSPPENEPASVTAIAKAVTSSTYSSGLASPSVSYGRSHTDDGSSRSLCNVSSTSSLGTSHSSGGSFASAFSHKSRGSFGSFGSFGNRGRRRRRRQAPKPVKANPVNGPARAFQCTFCTETFKTKHDWQRHEKSLHLSLERWVCSPDGPSQFCADFGHLRCVYCGLPNPPADHAEIHNHSSCAERSLEERTFYRKDHLRQHLNLVHDVKFQSFSMETWKVATPEIRSRCGFCGIIMDSWTFRVDHLAEHFKGGKSMADWKGDWGFEPQVLDIVENGMPPYLIHDERNSMNPFEASKESASDEKTLEDLIKIGLVEYVHDTVMKGTMPTDADLLSQARKIVQKADENLLGKRHPEGSWFRDLIILAGTTENEAPGHTDSSDYYSVKGLEMITAHVAPENGALVFSTCSKQKALMSFVEAKQALGLTPTDRQLQVECCNILDNEESKSNFQCKPAVAWFKYLATSSSSWLGAFRRRAGLPRTSEMLSEIIRSSDNQSIDYGIHNDARLEHELKDWIRFQVALGNQPSDADIQHQARLIVYKNDDPWNQTAVDDPALLHLVKRQSGLISSDNFGASVLELPTLSEGSELSSSHPSPARTLHWDVEASVTPLPSPSRGANCVTNPISPVDQPLHTLIQNQPSTNTNPTQPLKYFLNDANCYGRLVRELTRFVTTCMSPNNPNQHVPSDAEIQNQARWVIYDDDDPWNQTAADNLEWLVRFKRDVGLAPGDAGPGLPVSNPSWRVAEGGTGFSPPFLHPKADPPPFDADVPVTIDHKTYNIKAKTAQKFAKGLMDRWQKPAKVFCSRDLESRLGLYVQSEMAAGRCPSDNALRAKAREIMNMEETSADDAELLQKFKEMHNITANTAHLGDSMPIIDDALLAEFDHELNNMDLSTVDFSGSSHSHSSGSSPDSTILGQTHAQGNASGTEMKRSKGDGPAIDYAELYRVHAATASPLRRRASANATHGRCGPDGCYTPAGLGMGLGISPPRTTTALSGNIAAFSELEMDELLEEF